MLKRPAVSVRIRYSQAGARKRSGKLSFARRNASPGSSASTRRSGAKGVYTAASDTERLAAVKSAIGPCSGRRDGKRLRIEKKKQISEA